MRYIIIGDTDKYKDCLVVTCGGEREHAEKVLDRMVNNPTEQDKKTMEGYSNLRVEEVTQSYCWWDW